ncbi:hypothetical protein B0H19DRAFT_1346645, partial [Mycena capillaripes]
SRRKVCLPSALNPTLQNTRSHGTFVLFINPELSDAARGVVRLQRNFVELTVVVGFRDRRKDLLRHAREAGKRARAADAPRARNVADGCVGRRHHLLAERERERAPRIGVWRDVENIEGGRRGGARRRRGGGVRRMLALEDARHAPPEALHRRPGAAASILSICVAGCRWHVLFFLIFVGEDAADGAHGGGGGSGGGGGGGGGGTSGAVVTHGGGTGRVRDERRGTAFGCWWSMDEWDASVSRHAKLPEFRGQVVLRDLHRVGAGAHEDTLERTRRGVRAAEIEIRILEVKGDGAREVEGILEHNDVRHSENDRAGKTLRWQAYIRDLYNGEL